MTGPDLSVILPAYNAEEFIGPAIQSVLDQVPADREVEVVVADDGSVDGTAAAVDPLTRDKPVRYFRQENAGPSAARNLALGQARGRYLMFLDADDSLCDGCISTTLDFLDAHLEVGLFFTNYDIYDETGVVTASGVDTWEGFRGIAHREDAQGEWIFTESLAPHIVDGGAFMHTSGLTIRREIHEQIGPFHEGFSYGEDDEFYARAASITTAGYVDRILSRKRNHAASLIHTPAHMVRNMQHLLELSEIQFDYYRDDAGMQEILERKIHRCATSWAWHLMQAGRKKEARAALLKYRARYPGSWLIYRMLIRSLLPG